MLDGLRSRLGEQTEVRYAPGIRPAQRVFPSMFDMFPGNTPADPSDFDDEAELTRAVDLARDSDLAIVVLGEWQQMIGEAASRSSLELPGRQLELLQAVVGTEYAGGAAGDERAAARPALGGRARAGHPRHLVSGITGWGSRGQPAARRRLTRRQAALLVAPDRRAGADGLLPHHLPRAGESGQALLGRGEHAAVPVRLRAELRAVRLLGPVHRPGDSGRRRERGRLGHRHQHR